MLIPLDHDSDEPLYQQIAREIRSRIVSGEYPAGTEFPHLRTVGTELGVSYMTVRRAYEILEEDGLVLVNRKGARVLDRRSLRESGLAVSLQQRMQEAALGLLDAGFATDEVLEFVKRGFALRSRRARQEDD